MKTISIFRKANISMGHLLKSLLGITALAVPLAVVVASVVLPVTPFFQQALVGIMLIWIYLGAIIGFNFLS